jgi:hypothetical protein
MSAKHPDLENKTMKVQWIPGQDETMDRLDRYAMKKGLQRAAAARMLIKQGLDDEGAK